MALTQDALDALWDFSNPADSLARFEVALADTDGPEERAELQTQRARALGLLERYAEADEALEAIVTSGAALVATRVALERGRVRNSAGDPESAIGYFREAEQRAVEAGSVFLRVDALHMLALADAERAESWTSAALAALATSGDPRTQRWQVALHNNAGWSLFDAGRLDEALARFELARQAALRWGTPRQVELADEALAECRAALGNAAATVSVKG